jgi:hypothetical protein
MDDRRPKDSGGGEPPLQNVEGNHEQRNQQVNLPLFNIKMMTKRNGITTSLPPSESFTFIVREQECLHIFED